MRTYRVVLASFGTVLVEADSAVERDRVLWFIRDGDVHAKFPIASVIRYEEIPSAAFPSQREKARS